MNESVGRYSRFRALLTLSAALIAWGCDASLPPGADPDPEVPPAGWRLSTIRTFDGTALGTAGAILSELDVSGDTIAIGTQNAGIVFTTDGGETWTMLTQADGLWTDSISDILIDGNIIYVAGGTELSVCDASAGSVMDTYGNGGATTTAIALTVTEVLKATPSGLVVSPKSSLDSRTIYDHDDWGGTTDRVTAIHVDGDTVYLALIGYQVVVWNREAGTFALRSITPHAGMNDSAIQAVWGSGQDIVVSDVHTIARSADGGSAWSDGGIAHQGSLYAFSEDGDVLCAAKYRGPLVLSVDNGTTWIEAQFPAEAIDIADDSYVNDVAKRGSTLYAVHWNELFVGTLTAPAP